MIIVDTCTTATLTFTAPLAMTYSITAAALPQTITAATDNISTALAVIESCGPFTYLNNEGYTWMTIDSSVPSFSIYSANIGDAGVYTVTLKAQLTNYSAVFT